MPTEKIDIKAGVGAVVRDKDGNVKHQTSEAPKLIELNPKIELPEEIEGFMRQSCKEGGMTMDKLVRDLTIDGFRMHFHKACRYCFPEKMAKHMAIKRSPREGIRFIKKKIKLLKQEVVMLDRQRKYGNVKRNFPKSVRQGSVQAMPPGTSGSEGQKPQGNTDNAPEKS